MGQSSGQFPILLAQIGHRDDLPQAAARHRTDAIEAIVHAAIRRDDMALRIDLQPDTQCVGTDHARRQQLPDQRLARPEQITLRPGAVDDARHPHGLHPILAARTPMDDRAVAIRFDTNQLAALDRQLPRASRASTASAMDGANRCRWTSQ